MSQPLATTQPAVVPRSQYARVRSLLAGACIAILGLSVAIVLLASNRNVAAPRVAGASPTASVETAESGARLDHRGLRDAAWLSALAENGARLDHRGLRASSQP